MRGNIKRDMILLSRESSLGNNTQTKKKFSNWFRRSSVICGNNREN